MPNHQWGPSRIKNQHGAFVQDEKTIIEMSMNNLWETCSSSWKGELSYQSSGNTPAMGEAKKQHAVNNRVCGREKDTALRLSMIDRRIEAVITSNKYRLTKGLYGIQALAAHWHAHTHAHIEVSGVTPAEVQTSVFHSMRQGFMRTPRDVVHLFAPKPSFWPQP